MSMKQRVRSSSYSLNEGISPSRILQNTQSFMGPPAWGPRHVPLIPPTLGTPRQTRGAARHSYRSLYDSRLLDDDRPAVRIGRRRVLDPDDGVVQLLRQSADAPAVDHDALVLVGQLPHRRDDGGGAGAEHLAQ